MQNSSIDSAATADVDPLIWDLLNERLAVELKAVSAVAEPHLPSPELVTVADLAVTPLADGYWLEWSYRNPGDFNQDGEVNFGELSVLARHLGKSTASADWNEASLADGNSDGLISLADITTIAANWKASVNGYVIAVDLGDGDRNGLINIADLTPIGALINGYANLERMHSDPNGVPTWVGAEGDDFNQTVTPGTPGFMGPWVGFGLYRTGKGAIDEDGVRRFQFRLYDNSTNSWDYTGWTIHVVPTHYSGQLESGILWDWTTVGELSNMVTLPPLVQ